MRDNRFYLEAGDLEALSGALASAGDRSGRVVDRFLKESGGAEIQRRIVDRLPVSGRHWKGKPPGARQARPFRQQFAPLAVTISTQPAYRYLYFPDDGGNTRRHRGNQQFMLRGAEAAKPAILEGILGALTESILEERT